ncbi:MAG: hypothetical protein KAJ40_04390 [Alphaproteobacteria bacterium]|nr:hypothetical protein [Alphaproteobacteria bacterium]
MLDIIAIEKDDIACHWVFNPKHFSDAMPACLDLDVHVHFTSGSAHPYHMSVNSKNLCEKYPADVHNSGILQAARLSERNKKHRKDYNEQYVGFIKAKIKAIENIQYDDHALIVEHAPTEDNYSHCNIVLKFPESSSKPTKAKRTLMADNLKECFGNDIETFPTS